MNAGELRHRISIDTPTTSRNTAGEMVPVGSGWTYKLQTWAAIRPASAREIMLAGAVTPQVTHTVTIRCPRGERPTSGDRIRIGTTERALQIGSVVNVDERNVELRLVCYETGGGQ